MCSNTFNLRLEGNVLREIRSPSEIETLIQFVSLGHCFVHVHLEFLDHDESLRTIDVDEGVQFPVVDIPPVVSPMKARSSVHVQASKAEKGSDELVPI